MNFGVSDSDGNWHLDKRVPITIIVFLASQLIGFLWYISDLKKDIELLKMGQSVATDRDIRQDRLIGEAIQTLRVDIQILTSKVDRLVEQRYNGNGK